MGGTGLKDALSRARCGAACGLRLRQEEPQNAQTRNGTWLTGLLSAKVRQAPMIALEAEGVVGGVQGYSAQPMAAPASGSRLAGLR